jgi:hypothetical protein
VYHLKGLKRADSDRQGQSWSGTSPTYLGLGRKDESGPRCTSFHSREPEGERAGHWGCLNSTTDRRPPISCQVGGQDRPGFGIGLVYITLHTSFTVAAPEAAFEGPFHRSRRAGQNGRFTKREHLSERIPFGSLIDRTSAGSTTIKSKHTPPRAPSLFSGWHSHGHSSNTSSHHARKSQFSRGPPCASWISSPGILCTIGAQTVWR